MWIDTFTQWLDLRASPVPAYAGAHSFQNSYCSGLVCHCYNAHHSHPFASQSESEGIHVEEEDLDLGREVGIIMRQKEAGMHVRMLTQEIRKSLDRHTILSTTLFELSETLGCSTVQFGCLMKLKQR